MFVQTERAGNYICKSCKISQGQLSHYKENGKEAKHSVCYKCARKALNKCPVCNKEVKLLNFPAKLIPSGPSISFGEAVSMKEAVLAPSPDKVKTLPALLMLGGVAYAGINTLFHGLSALNDACAEDDSVCRLAVLTTTGALLPISGLLASIPSIAVLFASEIGYRGLRVVETGVRICHLGGTD